MEGGVTNAYDYPADPINRFDLSGQCSDYIDKTCWRTSKRITNQKKQLNFRPTGYCIYGSCKPSRTFTKQELQTAADTLSVISASTAAIGWVAAVIPGGQIVAGVALAISIVTAVGSTVAQCSIAVDEECGWSAAMTAGGLVTGQVIRPFTLFMAGEKRTVSKAALLIWDGEFAAWIIDTTTIFSGYPG